MPDDRDEQDWLFKNHPDLIDTRWTEKAAKRARKQARRQAPGAPGSPLRDRTIVLVIVVVAGTLLVAKHPWSSGSSTASPAVGHVVVAATPEVTATTELAKPLDLSQPFADTPAAGWQDGENGIRPPAAKAVGHFSAKQVATATAQVKRILVAAHLDPKMLINHDTAGYLALLAPTARAQEGKSLKTSRPDLNGRLTLLKPGFSLLPVPVKVNGTMSVTVGKDDLLVVHTNYVFAFPFAPADPSRIVASWQIVAVHHMKEDFEIVADKHKYKAADQGVFPESAKGYVDAMACEPSKQGLLAPAYSDTNRGTDTNDPDVYYDVNHTLDIGDC